MCIMFKIWHRWAAWYEPENTLLSFKKAISLWVDAVELDVFITKDQKVVVIHDETVDRTTNGDGYVSDYLYNDLSELDAGKWEHIPLLEEVLDLVNKRCIINIELKWVDTALYTADIIRWYIAKWWSHDLFIISSSNEFLLQEMKILLPQIPVGLIYSWIPIKYADIWFNTKSNILCLDREFINQAFIDDAHSKNIRVFVWTVDDIKEANKLQKMWIDWIFSNFPDLI